MYKRLGNLLVAAASFIAITAVPPGVANAPIAHAASAVDSELGAPSPQFGTSTFGGRGSSAPVWWAAEQNHCQWYLDEADAHQGWAAVHWAAGDIMEQGAQDIADYINSVPMTQEEIEYWEWHILMYQNEAAWHQGEAGWHEEQRDQYLADWLDCIG